ncbi:protein boule-like isoform X4 [Ornithodoros turicata]|uniref:protein boule-like isoform X3 n=1 Tax=Ornithodoros turicata TaxID=34597 RepID=UPI0031388009
MSASNSTEGGTLNAPRYGTVVPKRIFVGGISASTTEAELHELFSRFGVVTNAKIILDRAGVSKGYGFVTFDTEEDAQRAQASASNLTLRDRRLNIAPAIKKQPFTRVYDPTQSVPNGTILYHNGIPYTYHNGMAFFITPEYQYSGQTPAYPVIYQPSVYYPQHAFQYQNVSCFQPWICTVSSHRKESDWLQVASQWSPWRWNSSSNTSGAPTTYPYSAASDEYYDPAIVEASTEGGQKPVVGARREGTPRCSPPSYVGTLNSRVHPQGNVDTRHPQKPSSRHHLGVMVPKLVNGVAVLACPTAMSLPPSSTGGTACSTPPQIHPPRPRSAPKGPPWNQMEALGESLRALGL